MWVRYKQWSGWSRWTQCELVEVKDGCLVITHEDTPARHERLTQAAPARKRVELVPLTQVYGPIETQNYAPPEAATA